MPELFCFSCGARYPAPFPTRECPRCGNALRESATIAVLERPTFVQTLNLIRRQYERALILRDDLCEMDRFLLALGMALAELDPL